MDSSVNHLVVIQCTFQAHLILGRGTDCCRIAFYLVVVFFWCFLAVVSLMIICGTGDNCSDGSVMTVVCSSVSDFHGFPKDVKIVKRAFVDNVLVHFSLCVLTKC